MNESDYQFITVTLFSKLTGIKPSTVYYYCDTNQLPHTVISYGRKKKTRLINYREFLQLMELWEEPINPQRTDKRPGMVKLMETIEAVKRGRPKNDSSKMAVAL